MRGGIEVSGEHQAAAFWPSRVGGEASRRWPCRWLDAFMQRALRVVRDDVRVHWVAAAALPLAGLLAAGLFTLNNEVEGERAEVGRLTELLRIETARTVEAQAGVLAAVDASVRGLRWTDISGRPETHEMLTRLAASSPTTNALGLIDPDGRIAASSQTASPPRVDLSDRDYVRAFHAPNDVPSLFISAPAISRLDGRLLIHVARPRLPDSRTMAAFDGGIVVAGLRPDRIEALFARVADSPSTRIALLRDDGVLLAGQLGVAMPEPAAGPNDAALAVVRGTLLGGLRVSAGAAIGGTPLLLRVESDPSVVRDAWLRDMAFPALGAATTMLLMLLLTARTRREVRTERARGAARTAAAQAAQQTAQQRAELEARLRQTEKAAALGQLAAGVAHDFNNVLHAVMIGIDGVNRNLAELGVAEGHPAELELARATRLVQRTADRGMALTRRMLDFARRDDRADAETFEPAMALRQAHELLGRSLGQAWPVRLAGAARALPPVCGDAPAFETMLINLVVNARDAMPHGGPIEIAACLASAPGVLAGSGPAPRQALLVTVRDEGHGMDAATLARAGEAFFTTKPAGVGTGLGLSMARGFVQRAGGLVEIDSAPGAGTTITIWLPTAG